MFNKNIRKFKDRLFDFFNENISFIIFVFVLIYAVFFLVTLNSLNTPESEIYTFWIFFLPSFGIIIWIVKIITDKLRGKPGAGLTLRLTLYFMLITSIPFIVLFFNSANMVERIYQDYISLDEVEPKLNKMSEVISKKSAGGLLNDINNSMNILKQYQKKDNKIKSSEYYLELKHSDYLIIYEAFDKHVKIISYIIDPEYERVPRKEINNEILNNILKDVYFFDGEFKNNLNEDKYKANSYNLENNKVINYYNKYIEDFSQYIKPVDEEASDKTKIFIIAVSEISKYDLDLSKQISELSGIIAKLSINRNDAQVEINRYIIFISLPIVLIAILLSFYLAIRFTRPMEMLIKGTKGVAAGDLKYRIPSHRQDELGRLIEAFNKMAMELEQNKFSLFRAEKAAAWREVARKLAHEIKNPLTPIKLASERIKRQYYKKNPNIENIINSCSTTIIEEVDRLSYIVQEFSEFARTPESKKSKENIKAIVKNIVDSYSEIRFNIKFEFVNDLNKNEEFVLLDKKQFKQVMINLLENSVDALPEHNGMILVNMYRVDYGPNPYCVIEIKDNGGGIPEEVQKSIFTPYFTTKDNGTGLGLVIVKNIVEEHDGKIYFKSVKGEGTTFYMKFPLLIKDVVIDTDNSKAIEKE